MLLTIIIPVYNAARYVKECIESIMLANEKEEIEILLIDDGSTDASLEICREYECDNIKVFHQNNSGVSLTRNFGIQVAQGKYIMFVDADDRLSESWYNLVRPYLLGSEEIVYFTKGCSNPGKNKVLIFDAMFGWRKDLNLGNMFSPWSKIFLRRFLLNYNITFDSQLIMGEDSIFNINALIKATNYKFVSKSFYYYRINYLSCSKRMNPKFFESNLRYINVLSEIFNNLDIIDKKRNYSYIGFSVSYSIYLFLSLIAGLNCGAKKKEYINLFSDARFSGLIIKYRHYKPNNKIVWFVYDLILNGQILFALAFVSLIKHIKLVAKRNKQWELI